MNLSNIFVLLFLLYVSPILAGSTNTQKSIPSNVVSQQVISQSQIFDSLMKKINHVDSLLQKQSIQTVSTPVKENWLKENTGLIKDWANIAFFVVAITGTLITFGYNRKTLFSPLRTEVFKKQFEIYCDILKIITDPQFVSHRDVVLLNLLSFLDDSKIYEYAIENNLHFKNVLMQNFRVLELPNSRFQTISASISSRSNFFKSGEEFVMARIKIDYNTFSKWEELEALILSPLIANKVKVLVQELIYNMKENIKKHLPPLIETEVKKFDKNSAIPPTPANPTNKKTYIAELIIILKQMDIYKVYENVTLNYRKEIEILNNEICKQLKIFEIVKKSQVERLILWIKSTRTKKVNADRTLE